MVFVEGGPQQIKKYVALLLRRIKWEKPSADLENDNNLKEDGDGAKDKAEDGADQKCFLVWQGVADKALCPGFKATFDVKREAEATKIFSERKLDHMWTTAVNFQAKRALATIGGD